jgi:hypothetical protein
MPLIATIALSVSICALLVSLAALYLSRQDIRNAIRAEREQADYLSYRLGVDLGEYRAAGGVEKVPSPAPNIVANRRRVRSTVQARIDKLGLGIEVPNPLPFDTTHTDVLIYQAHICIRDYHGQRSVDHFVLGVNVGQAIGYLLPWSGSVEAKATGTGSPSASVAVPREVSAELAKLAAPINVQLEALGFKRRLHLSEESGATLYNRLNELDRGIIGIYDPREQRWHR